MSEEEQFNEDEELDLSTLPALIAALSMAT
mgnify:CR=1 FL=1